MSTTSSFYLQNKINVAVDLLLNDYHFFSTTEQFNTQDNFYVYDSSTGIYVLDAELFIADKLNELFPDSFTHYSHIRSVIDQIQNFSPVIPNDQVDPPHLVNHTNGIHDKKRNKLLPHSYTFYTTKQLPKYIIEDNTSSLSMMAKKLELLNFVD